MSSAGVLHDRAQAVSEIGRADRLVRVREAAHLLGVSVRRVYEMLSDGTLKRIKQPGCKSTFLLLSQIQAYISKLAGCAGE